MDGVVVTAVEDGVYWKQVLREWALDELCPVEIRRDGLQVSRAERTSRARAYRDVYPLA